MVSTIQPASPILKLKSDKLCSDDPDFQQMDEVLFASSPSDPFRECCFGPSALGLGYGLGMIDPCQNL